MSNFNRSPLLSLKSPVVAPNPNRVSQYTEVDISEYFDESVGEHDFLPSVPASPLRALFSTTMTSNNIPPRATTRSTSPNKNTFLMQKRADLAMVPGPQLSSPPRPPRLPRSNAADAPRSVISSIPTARSRPVSVSSSPTPPRQYLINQNTAQESHIPLSMQPDLEKVLRKPTYLGKPAGSSPPPTVILPTSSDYFNRKEATEMVRKTRRIRNARRILMVFIIVFAVALGVAAGVITVVLKKKASSGENDHAVPVNTNHSNAPGQGNSNLLRRSPNPSFQGDGTFYNTGLGACGETSNDEELVCALNVIQFKDLNGNPNNSVFCGRCLEVSGPLGSVKVKIVDKCPGCKEGDLDLSPAAFKKIAKIDDGRVSISWKFCEEDVNLKAADDATRAILEAISSAVGHQ